MTIKVCVPRDSTALSLGADEVAAAILVEAARRGVAVKVVRTSSRGLFWLEPLVEVSTPSGRVAYGPVTAADVAVLGPPDARDVLLVQSGTHGVEGYCGSGVQHALLRAGDELDSALQAGVLEKVGEDVHDLIIHQIGLKDMLFVCRQRFEDNGLSIFNDRLFVFRQRFQDNGSFFLDKRLIVL
jgi:formate dehydrogenase iron-sulfur subunit